MHKAQLAATALAMTLTGAALAQPADNFPSKPITIAFPVAGPGAIDTEFRLHVEAMRQIPNTPQFIIEYKGGAGGVIGARHVAQAAPDGYTLLGTAAQLVTLPLTSKEADFDASKSFAPIMLLSKRFYMFMVHPSAPFRNLKEYLAYAQSHPGELLFGATGAGGSVHMPALMLHSMTKTKVSYVFYKQPNDRLTDLIAGRTHVTVGTTLSSAGFVKSGKLRPIALTGDRRSPLFPDLPTVAESGIKGYEYSGWSGLLAPAKTPASIVSRINGYFQQSSKTEMVTKKMQAGDVVLVAGTPQEFGRFLGEETQRLSKVIKEAGITSVD